MIDALIAAIAAAIGTGPVDGGTARVLACAGATRPSLVPAQARGSVDVALLVGAVAGGLRDARRRIEHGLPSLTAPAALIDALDPLLCDVDPTWAWHLARTHAVAAGAGTFAALLADLRGDVDGALDERWAEARAAMRQVAAAVAGRPFAFDRAWYRLLDSPRTLTLAALAVADPLAALEELRGHRGDCPLARVPGVAELASRTLAGHGRRLELASLAPDLGVATRALWVHELGAGGALAAAALDAELRALAEALVEHADPGDEARDGVPILSGLAIRGHAAELVARAAEWRCPPPLFASVVFAEADAATAAAVIELDAIGRLAACPRDEWSGADGWWMSDWWLAAEAHGDPLGACRDVLDLATTRPWGRTLGTIVDLVERVRAIAAG